MIRADSIRLLMTAVLALATTTYAQNAQRPAGTPAQQAQASLAEAIRAAEQASGGRARKAEIERENGVDAYEIKTVAKDRTTEVIVDPATAKVLRLEHEGFFERMVSVFDRSDRRKNEAAFAWLAASKMTLADAVATAEREVGGRAVKASLTNQHGQTFFKVGMFKDLALQKVGVDPASGKVVTIAQGKDKDDD